MTVDALALLLAALRDARKATQDDYVLAGPAK